MDPSDHSLSEDPMTNSVCGKLRSGIKKRIKNQVPPQGKEDLSDIAQDAVMAACEKIDQFHGKTYNQLIAWVYRIAVNRCRDAARFWKRECRDVAMEQPMVDDVSKDLRTFKSPESQQKDELLEMIEKAISRLPDSERLAIQLKHIENKSLKETAQIMNRTTESVAGLLKRGLKRLKSFNVFGDAET